MARIGFPVDRASCAKPKLEIERVKHESTIVSTTCILPSSIRLKRIASAGAEDT
jgi:hypothetical protein